MMLKKTMNSAGHIKILNFEKVVNRGRPIWLLLRILEECELPCEFSWPL